MAQQRQAVFLVGDSGLVLEWGELFHRNGWHILYKINKEQSRVTFPKHFKKALRPSKATQLGIELTNIDLGMKEKNLAELGKSISSSSVLLTSSITVSATEQSTWIKYPQRLLGISALPSLLNNNLVELAPTVHTKREVITYIQELLKKSGKESAVIQDRVGMVMPRILCMLVNEAMFALTEGIASPQDIDTAMKLGTNYPAGPVQWGNSIGLKHVLSIIDALYNDLHEERYRAAPLLRQLSTGTQWWKS